jgi:hypothetical protein
MAAGEEVRGVRAYGVRAVAAALRESWRRDSAWIDDWDACNPARGQCGSSALVLQDLCGGALLSGLVREPGGVPIVHYWNLFAAGAFDATWDQFACGARVVQSREIQRHQLLVGRWFTERYEALRGRVGLLLAS